MLPLRVINKFTLTCSIESLKLLMGLVTCLGALLSAAGLGGRGVRGYVE